MNLHDNSVLDKINTLIVMNRLNKSEILKMVNLVSISNDIKDLIENIEWEASSKKD